MPTLPTYSSKGKLTTQQPAATRTGAGQVTQAAGELARVAFDAGAQLLATRNATQAARALADYEYGIKQIENDASIDTNPENLALYTAKVQGLKDENIKRITDATVRERVSFEMTHRGRLAEIGLNGMFHKKQLEVNKVATLRRLELLQQDYALAQDQKVQEAIKAKKRELINEAIGAGVFSVIEGEKVYDRVVSDGDKLREAVIKASKEQRKIDNYTADGEAAIAYLDGKLTPEVVMYEQEQGNISYKVGKALHDLMVNGAERSAKNIDNKVFNKLVDTYYSLGEDDHGKMEDLRVDIINAYKLGQIGPPDFDMLMRKTTMPFGGDTQEKMTFFEVLDYLMLPISGVGGSANIVARLGREFFNNVQRGFTPAAAAQQAVRGETLRAFPMAAGSKGYQVIDANGVRKIITPEGDIVDSMIGTKK